MLPPVVDDPAVMDQAGEFGRQPDQRVPDLLDFLQVSIGVARRVAVEKHEAMVVARRGRIHSLPDSEVENLAVLA